MSEEDGKITWRVRGIESIANEMMKGLSPDRYNAASDEEKKRFLERHTALIEKIVPHLPRGYSAVGAAVCKCAIRYGEERAIEFLKNLKYTVFKGRRDPVYLFSLWIDNPHREKKNRIPYKLAMIACRAYCQERQLAELRVPAGDRDIFELEDNWEFDVDRYGKRKGRKKKDRKPRKPSEDSLDDMKQKITLCIAGLKEDSRTKYTKEVLEPVVKEATSISEVLEKLGLAPGGNHTRILRRIKKYNISTAHFRRQRKSDENNENDENDLSGIDPAIMDVLKKQHPELLNAMQRKTNLGEI